MKTDYDYFKLMLEMFVTLVQVGKERKRHEKEAGWPEEYGNDLPAITAATHLFHDAGFKDYVRRNLFLPEPERSKIIQPLLLGHTK